MRKSGKRITNKQKEKILRQRHERAVEVIAQDPELLGIEELKSETILAPPLTPARLRGDDATETGDIVFVRKSSSDEWEVVVIEVTVGTRRPTKKDRDKLNLTVQCLKDLGWQRLFVKLGLKLPPGCRLVARTISVGYAGIPVFWEKPLYLEQEITLIQERRVRI